MTSQALRVACACVLTLGAVPAQAGEAGALYAQISSNGPGLGYAFSLSDNWALRAQYNSYQRNFTGNLSDTGSTGNLDVQLKLETTHLLADWYPTQSGFRLTLGGVANNNRILFKGTGNVNGVTTNVDGNLKFSKGLSPYLGLGYSSRPALARGWGFTVDFGLMFQDPSVELQASGNGVTQSDVDAQKAKIEDDAKALRRMPVLGVGLSYAF